MMDLETIHEFQAEAAAQAARNKLEPYLAEADDVGRIDRLRHIPSIGGYLPDGWERVDPSEIGPHRTRPFAGTIGKTSETDREVSKYWVDSSGMGGPDEMAMPAQEFADLVKPGYGYAIVEEGQFQIGIGVFRRVK